ncbi:MAG TPA: hypothetical protein VHQ66_10335, partial [Myxococcota bacterium]|nr:hypothetical protein [Myxococcota bacterium]
MARRRPALMHFASFDLGDPLFDAHGLRVSLQIATLENVYGLDPRRTSARLEGGDFAVRAAGLACAGQQVQAEGKATLHLRAEGPGRVRCTLRARAPAPIRGVKLLLRDLPAPLRLVDEAGEREVGAGGEIVQYPNRIPTPLVTARAGAATVGIRVEDPDVREKRFAFAVERAGALAGRGAIEVVLDEDATEHGRDFVGPPVVIERDPDPARFLDEHLRFLERAYGLAPFAERPDVSAWARELQLAVTLHGMHWTGRAFLDYGRMLDVLRFVTDRIEGRRVLAYLPGFEGRYYWQYGEWRPEPRLGGEEGFAALCKGARELGVHVMPMFGGNCVNARLPRFAELDPRAYLKSATGNRFHGNQPDWDFSRAHDTGWQAWLNPGHPGFRADLAGQIEALAARFGFDGVFLDTIHVWLNDPDHSVYAGTRALVERLRAAIPGVL